MSAALLATTPYARGDLVLIDAAAGPDLAGLIAPVVDAVLCGPCRYLRLSLEWATVDVREDAVALYATPAPETTHA